MTEEPSERLYGLDHLRAAAIILVLMYHYRAFEHPLWIDRVGRFGWTGVDLFFVLSGFLISGQLFKEIDTKGSLHLKTFYIKRFFRIIPPYLFTLFLYFAIPLFREREALSPLWKFLTFTQNYGLNVIDRGTFSHAWSLCIEEQFYLILPVLLLIAAKTKRFKYLPLLIIVVIAFSIMYRLMVWNECITTLKPGSLDFWRLWYMKIYYPTHTRLDGLSVGVLIGYLMQYSSGFKKWVHQNGNMIFLGGMLLLGISFWMCDDQASERASLFGFTIVALSYGMIVMSAVSKSSFLYRSKSYITSQLAALSYAVYLSHKGIIHMTQAALERFDIQASGHISLVFCLLACITGGILYRFLLEIPFSRIKFRILKREK